MVQSSGAALHPEVSFFKSPMVLWYEVILLGYKEGLRVS